MKQIKGILGRDIEQYHNVPAPKFEVSKLILDKTFF